MVGTGRADGDVESPLDTADAVRPPMAGLTVMGRKYGLPAG